MADTTDDDALVEAMARGMLECDEGRRGLDAPEWARWPRREWETLSTDARQRYLENARAARAIAVPVVKERCAQVADEYVCAIDPRGDVLAQVQINNAAKSIAAAIRSQGD
jgi:hypothetical protein